METENEIIDDATTQSKKEKSHDRSASYPALTLNEAIEFGSKVYKNFSNAVVTRHEIANVLKVHANSISRHCGACSQFGLFEKTGEGYRVTTILDRIVNPENTKDKKIAKLEAFGSPKIYKELIEKLDGSFVPNELPNTLIKHHSITAKAAPEAAEVFITSAQEAEAIGESRVLKYRDTLSSTQKITGYAEILENDTEGENKTKSIIIKDKPKDEFAELSSEYKKVPIHLTKNKVSYFAYPANTSESDIKIIKHQIDGILLQIQLDNEEKENKNGNE